MREFLYFRHMVFDPVEITNVEFIYIFVLSRLTRSPFLCKRKICMYSLIHQKLRCVTSSGSQRDCTLGQILRELLNLVYLVSMIIFRPKKV